MIAYFYNADGSPEMGRQYTGPGLYFWDQKQEIYSKENFNHTEGKILKFHVGHGAFRTYRVEAIDAKTALLRAA